MSSDRAHSANLDASAQLFLNRLDAIEDITPVHHIFLVAHPEDKHKCVSELIPEIKHAAATNISPFRLQSLSGKVREIAKEHRQILKNADERWPKPSSLTMWRSHIRGRVRLLRHFFRIPCLILSIILSIHLFQTQSLANWFENEASSHAFNFIVQAYLAYFAISQVHFIVTHDTAFRRAFLKLKTKVTAGLYFNASDTRMKSILSKMPMLTNLRPNSPCCWENGDIETLLAVVLHEKMIDPQPGYIRRWIKSYDGEGFSFDLAFPKDEKSGKFYHNPARPLIILNHGLNGDSNNSFIRAHAAYYNSQGCTIAAITARGFGTDGILLKYSWNGARTQDLEYLIKAMHIGCGNNTIPDLHTFSRKHQYSLKSGSIVTDPQLLNLNNTAFINNEPPMNILRFTHHKNPHHTPVCAIGFSMSGILVAKYCAVYGENTGLTAATSVCALGDRMKFGHNPHSEMNWEPMLCDTARGIITRHEPLLYTQYKQKSGQLCRPGIVSAATSRCIREIDTVYTCKAAGLDSVEGYYTEGLSFTFNFGMDNIATPLFIIFPENDPIINVDGLYPAVQLLLPYKQRDQEFHEIASQYTRKPIDTNNRTDAGHVSNISIFVPPYGGHISSFRRWDDKWGYLSELTLEYFTAATSVTSSPLIQHSKDELSLFDSTIIQGSEGMEKLKKRK